MNQAIEMKSDDEPDIYDPEDLDPEARYKKKMKKAKKKESKIPYKRQDNL